MRCGIVGVLAIAAVMSVSGAAMAHDPTFAAFVNGNQLYAASKSEAPRDIGSCTGYIFAVADAAAGGDDLYGVSVCLSISSAVIGQQAIDVVKQYLAAHPALRNANAASLVAHALSEAWPCAGSH